MAKIQKHGLGSGLDQLIPKNLDTSLLAEVNDKIYNLKLTSIIANDNQPRKIFDNKSLNELAESIKLHGVIQPIVVISINGGKYQIVAGERRYRASQIAGKSHIPAIVKTIKELQQLEIAMIENMQREDLSTVDQALAIEKLHQQFNLTYDEIAKKLGKHISSISNTARLLQLPSEAIDALNKKLISEGHARSILALKDYPKHQANLLKACIDGWSVRQAERYVVSVKKMGVDSIKVAQSRVALNTPETEVLGKKLHTTVQVRRMAKGGRLEILFNNDTELQRLIELINSTR